MPIIIGDVKLYTVPEVAELLQLEEPTIRAMLRRGQLKGKKVANRWHVAEEWLQELFMEPSSPAAKEA